MLSFTRSLHDDGIVDRIVIARPGSLLERCIFDGPFYQLALHQYLYENLRFQDLIRFSRVSDFGSTPMSVIRRFCCSVDTVTGMCRWSNHLSKYRVQSVADVRDITNLNLIGCTVKDVPFRPEARTSNTTAINAAVVM